MTQISEGPYFTVSEAARLLKVSPSTIWRWIEAGRLPAYRVGPRNIRIGKDALEIILLPARRRMASAEGEGNDIWTGYDPQEVSKTVAKMARSWADLDGQALITALYRARMEGTRTESRG